ncbi:hypothetical protein [Burkholderia gladioli]|uniref:hypothetical protein n=1 Tax=Burkholderia gladioli TaxID=28095 RepID=UPI00164056EF|nr:hypothetical protein [Burkholderia gladioli]
MAQTDGVPAVEIEPFVLYIDLDFFHSEDGVEPGDAATFYRLVRNAVAVRCHEAYLRSGLPLRRIIDDRRVAVGTHEGGYRSRDGIYGFTVHRR